MTPELAEPMAEPSERPSSPAGELAEVNPRVPLLAGPLAILRSLRDHHHLATNFIARDIRLKYRDSALGYAWSLLEPLMLSAVYYFLFVVLAGKPDERHVVWIILGVITWQFFAKSVNGTVTCLTRNESMIKQVYFPRELFALTYVGSQLVFAVLSLVVAIPLMIYFRIPPTAYLLMVPLGLLLVAVLSLGIGLALAPLNVVNRDVEHMLKFVTRAGMFVSPVMWTVEMAASRASLVHYALYNPMTVPITLVRNGVGGAPLGLGVAPVASAIAVAAVAFVLGAIVFKRYEAQVVKKL
jgi:ABC-2 type transport system permease protein